MSNSPCEHIMEMINGAALAGVTIGGASGWRLACGRMTDQPDEQICMFDSPGQQPNPKWLLDYPFVQVLVRGSPDGYQAARAMVQSVYDVLLGAAPRTMGNGDVIDAITIIGTPSSVGQDQKNRPLISTNYRLIVEPVTNALTNRLPL